MRSFQLVVVAGLLGWLAPASAWAHQLQCYPCSHYFGSAPIGTSSPYSIPIGNAGKTTLRITAMSIQGAGYSLGNFTLPVQLAPGAGIQLPVVFTPTALGYMSAGITLTSNDPKSPLYISVAGTGLAPTAPPAQLGVTPSLSFGNVTVGASANLTATLTAANADVTISSDQSNSSQFAILGLNLPVTIPAGQSISVTIQFTPNASGTASAQAAFFSNAANSPTLAQLTGTGVPPSSTPAQLGITPSLSFGNITVGSSASLTATLTASNAAVTVSSDQSNSSEFAIIGLNLPVTIPAGQSVAVTIQFTPNASGMASALAGFFSNAANSPTLTQLTGTGVAPGSHSVSLSWNPGDGSAVGYNVYRASAQTGPFQAINTALDSSTNYTDYSVASGATYYYVTTEVNAQGQESGYSNEVQAVIPTP